MTYDQQVRGAGVVYKSITLHVAYKSITLHVKYKSITKIIGLYDL